jgi:hypothetical protein
MSTNPKWTRQQVSCKENKARFNLLIEWQEKDGKEVIQAIYCDNSKLGDYHLSDCDWSCWEKFSAEKS